MHLSEISEIKALMKLENTKQLISELNYFGPTLRYIIDISSRT